MTYARAWAALALLCLLVGSAAPTWAAGQPRTILAEGRGHPWVNVLDGRELPVIYRGDSRNFERQLRTGQLEPEGMTSADLDGDGLEDLVAAYDGPDGAWLTLHRANLDARDPGGPQARVHRTQGTFSDTPFLPEARVVPLPASPRMMVAGDFDGDGHVDLVVADGVTAGFWWLPGTGTGDLLEPRFQALRGVVTALTAGNINRRDDLDDIVAGVLTAEHSEVVVLRCRDDGFQVESSVLTVEQRIVALALGRLGADGTTDLAVAAGAELSLLPVDESGKLPSTAAWRRAFPAAIRALDFGDFADAVGRSRGLALWLDDASVRLLRHQEGSDRRTEFTWVQEDAPLPDAVASLVTLNLSNRPGHDLVLNDRAGRQLSVRIGGLPSAEWATFETAAPAAAILPMHLNGDIFTDLVVQLEGSTALTLLVTAPRSIFTVDSVADGSDMTSTDGLCATAGGACTLRAAIEQANASGGTDAVGFDIPGAGPHTLRPLTPLPAISDPLSLDATTEPDYAGTPVVELDGSLAGSADGLVVVAGSTTIEGLAVNRFENNGLVLGDVDAVENRIQSNFIGTDVFGSAAAGNAGAGVFVYGGAQLNVVGTDGDGVADDREGNLISANGGDGIAIVDQDTDGNVVAGNLVGTDVGGTVGLANGGVGVALVNYPKLNRVGTDGDGMSDVEERNVISGNVSHGVLIAGEAEQNVVAGNYIGADASGSQALPNANNGLEVSNGARFNRIGTDADGQADDLERNVISANGWSGITMFGTPQVVGNTIAGNYIGTDAGGTSALGNGDNGIYMGETTDARIGGSVPAARNVISGNTNSGVYIGDTSSANLLRGNFIGTDASGTTPLGNGSDGVFIGGSPSNIVGTDGDGLDDDTEGNLISANGSNGVLVLAQGADQNVVAGNWIGVDVTGTLALGNGEQGVAIVDSSHFNRVGTDGDGTSDSFEGNLISGNVGVGVLVAFNSADNVVAGNLIGTDATGVLAVANGGFGVELSNGALRNRIGTNVDGQSDTLERNVISGNGSVGVSLFGSPSTDDNVIAGNYIGTQADGTSPLGNLSHGILINTAASYNTIGGLGTTPRSCDGPCNVIAFNGIGASLDGVRIVDGAHNTVVGNVIHSNNAGAGIDIAEAATSFNDPGDVDGGANNGQNFPVLTEATSSGGTTTVQGTLDSLPSTEFRVELFSNTAGDPSGFGEGETLVAVHTLTTGATGQASFSVPVTPALPDGQWLSATATRMEPGNLPTDTSEFSPCMVVGAVTGAGTVPDGVWVPGTRLTADRGEALSAVVLSWSPSCVAADLDYAVYIGAIGDYGNHFARRCSTEGQTTTRFRNNDPAIYILVAPLSGNREGSYGTDGDGFERSPTYSVCHPQLIAACD